MKHPALFLLAWALVALSGPARAERGPNPIHPAFAPLDASGNKVTRAEDLSPDMTCGVCHDVTFIRARTSHGTAKASANCVHCHVEGGRLPVEADKLDAAGRLPREALRIGSPQASACAPCHTRIIGLREPLSLAAGGPTEPGERRLSLTFDEGAIISAQRMADAFLNLADKPKLSSPWDVHAAKLVDCIACHHASNDPSRIDERKGGLRYVTADPRRPTTAEFLARPSHQLTATACRTCHDPSQSHAFLPYRSRHMEVLACQACHLAAPMAPVLELVDGTVVNAAGGPAVVWRNVEPKPGETLNTATLRAFVPPLVERVEADGARRLTPVNTVARYRWTAGALRAEVPWAQVKSAFLGEGGGYAPAVLARFDANKDGALDERELRLDAPEKVALIAERLAALGVADPRIDGLLEVHVLNHGVPSPERALRDCDACHTEGSRLAGDHAIAPYLPGGVTPRPDPSKPMDLAGTIGPGPGGSLVLARAEHAGAGGLHVLGLSRQALTNTLGFAMFLAVAVGCAFHALLRVATRGKRAAHAALHPHPEPTGKEYIFGGYERLWHWTMALSGIVLIVTGLAIHTVGWRPFFALTTAVTVHNAFAVVLMVNATFALFYHLATRTIRNLIPARDGLMGRMLEHMTYQGRGIFFGGPHPTNAPGDKLNPLQQVTYLALLNILFPLQIATGLLLWAAGNSPAIATAVSGLRFVAPLHNVGSWLFITFFVLHVYLVSTGRTPTEHLVSMITGYAPIEGDGGEGHGHGAAESHPTTEKSEA